MKNKYIKPKTEQKVINSIKAGFKLKK